MNTLPQYCCAIIFQQEQGTIIMEQRPDSAHYAPGRLCCFGGARETHEDPMDCIQRELREELSWTPLSTPSALSHVHTLHRGQQCIAWFYRCTLDRPLSALSCEAGRSIVSVDLRQRHLFPISNWHRLVLDNYLGNITDSDLLTIHE